jgi:trehalose synthase-fused probable maltokinase
VRVADWSVLRDGPHPAFLAIVDVTYRDGSFETYSLPLAMATGLEAEVIEREHPQSIVARISGARKGLLYDGMFDDGVCLTLLAAIEEGADRSMRRGALQAVNSALTADDVPPETRLPIVRFTSEQSNTTVKFGQRLVLKMFRHLEPGQNPDVEIGRFLSTRTSARVPQLLGDVEYVRAGARPASLALVQRFVWNQGIAWDVTVEELGRFYERALGMDNPPPSAQEAASWLVSARVDPPPHVSEAIRAYLAIAQVIGRRTGELHRTLAEASGNDFAPEVNSRADLSRLAADLRQGAAEQLRTLRGALSSLEPMRRALAERVLALEDRLHERIDRVDALADGGQRIRVHGDYHLGQLLVTEGDVVIIDFEGEPARTVAERRAKASPLRDVAGMIRSFGYAAAVGLGAVTIHRAEDRERLAPWAQYWQRWVSAVFRRAYRQVMRDTALMPPSDKDVDVLLGALEIEKALYELGYELNHRPEWVHVPLAGLVELLRHSPHAARPLKATTEA